MRYKPNLYKSFVIEAINRKLSGNAIRSLFILLDKSLTDGADVKIHPLAITSYPDDFSISGRLVSDKILFASFYSLFTNGLVLRYTPTEITHRFSVGAYGLNFDLFPDKRRKITTPSLYDSASFFVINKLYDGKFISPREYRILIYLAIMSMSSKHVNYTFNSKDDFIGIMPIFKGTSGHKKLITVMKEVGIFHIIPKYYKNNIYNQDWIKLNTYNIASLYHQIISKEDTFKASKLRAKLELAHSFNPDFYQDVESLGYDIMKLKKIYEAG